MSRSYSTFREQKPFTDGWKEAIHSATAPSDHVHRPFVLESEGKQMPIIRYASGSNGETFVMKAEIIEHSIVPAAPEYVPKYSYRFQPWEEFRDFGDENGHHYHNRDQLFEEFIKKVQDEACRLSNPSVPPPLINSWRSGPNNRPTVQENNRKFDDERRFRRDGRKNPNWERHNEPPYLTNRGANYAHPVHVMGNNRIVPENNRRYDEERNFGRDDHKKLEDNPNWERHNEPYITNKGTNYIRPVPAMGNNRIVPENNREYDDGRYFRRDELDYTPNRERHNEPYMTNKGTNTNPVMGNYRTVPENNRKYDEGRNFRRDDPKKQDSHNEPYLTSKGTNITQPVIGKNRDGHEFYERPVGNEGPNARSHPISRTTNDIDTAMEFLKESYDNGKEKDQKESNNGVYKEPSRPPTTTFPLPIARWRNPTNMSGPDTKVKPMDSDSEEEEEEEEKEEKESRNPLGKFTGLKIANNGRGEKPLERYESPKSNAPAVQFGQTAGKKITPEKIDSREASRRYGKLPSRSTEEEHYEGILTSEEAKAKYQGALVP